MYFVRNAVYNASDLVKGLGGTWAHHGLDLNLAVREGTRATSESTGAGLRAAWYELAATGKVAAWQATNVAKAGANVHTNANAAAGEHGLYQISLQNGGDPRRGVQSQNVRGLLDAKCAAWTAQGYGTPQYWWSN